MRKLFGILVVAILVTACTPEQIALVKREVHNGAIKVSVVQPTPNQLAQAEGSPFLEAVAAVHNDPFLVCTRAHESDTAGGYVAYNPSGPWYGAYQFTQGTWDNSARHAGLPQYAGANILEVPGFIQDFVAYDLYRWQGNGPWGGRC